MATGRLGKQALVRKQQTFTSSGTWTLPTGFGASNPCIVEVDAIGGGGGGGGSNSPNSGGGGGSGYRVVQTVSATANQTVTIGTAGAAAASITSDGGDGGASSFGALAVAAGGKGGKQNFNNTDGAGGAGGVNGAAKNATAPRSQLHAMLVGGGSGVPSDPGCGGAAASTSPSAGQAGIVRVTWWE